MTEEQKKAIHTNKPEREERISPAAPQATYSEGETDAADGSNAETNHDPLALLSLTVESAAEEHQAPSLDYPVVGFGAAAESLQAFKTVLGNLDPNTGMSFVLVTHMAAVQKSLLSEIVDHYTQMPVHFIENGQRPLINHLYVLLPNQTLRVRDGVFHVNLPVRNERSSSTIDDFLYSLAGDQKNLAIGVLLSAEDSDGALGLKAIEDQGGIAIVHRPGSAVAGDTSRNSIAGEHVDLVIPPAEIALELGRLAHQFTLAEVRSLQAGAISPGDDRSYQTILQLLRGQSGLDLHRYKPGPILRRIARRMLLQRMDRLSHYLRFLETRPDELRRLQEDVLINATRFFLDPLFWESLHANVLSSLLQDRPREKPIRIWCAGCSTGEEAYSLAILVLEHLSLYGLETPVQIFGTDASDPSIETARLGAYPEALLSHIPPEQLRRYFVKVDHGYQVSKQVRDTCIFARHNLCSDPPFSQIDIVSCRNVMIGFDQTLQQQAMLGFHHALESGGYILLGICEELRDYGEIFLIVDRKHKIYRKCGANLPLSYESPRTLAVVTGGGVRGKTSMEIDAGVWPELELQRAADRIVLSRFGPPGLIVDERMNVLQSRGQISQYVQVVPGTVTWSLPRVLKAGLINEVSAAVQRTVRENRPTAATAIFMDEQNGEQRVRIEVLPITGAAPMSRYFLILFENIATGYEGPAAQVSLPLQIAGDDELLSIREEIRSANQKLLVSQQELETTRQELQSAREVLETVNIEMQQRDNLLTTTGNDLSNLLNSVDIPLLMLTHDLRIRQFTPPIQHLLNVRPSDIGRPLSQIRLQLSVEDIQPLLREVLETRSARELQVLDREGRWRLLRVRPYSASGNKIEGLVVLLLDIDQMRRIQRDLANARDFTSSMLENMPVPLVVLNRGCAVLMANAAFRELTKMPAGELEGRSLPDLAKQLWGIEGLAEKLNWLFNSPSGTCLDFEHSAQDRPSLLLKAQALTHEGDRVLLLVLEDVSARRGAEQLLATQKEVLDGTQNELRQLAGRLLIAQEEERRRLARDLHDDLSQRLSLLAMLLNEIEGASSKTDKEKLEEASRQLSEINSYVRQISHRLHPSILTDLGLPIALQALVKEFGESEKMPATYLSQELPRSWPPEAALAIYRIAQEALHNISKHAGNTPVEVLLSGTERGLQLKITDFGLGFSSETLAPATGLGMISMQERARLAGGTFQVQSALGQGTTITVDIPLVRDL